MNDILQRWQAASHKTGRCQLAKPSYPRCAEAMFNTSEMILQGQSRVSISAGGSSSFSGETEDQFKYLFRTMCAKKDRPMNGPSWYFMSLLGWFPTCCTLQAFALEGDYMKFLRF